jgi:hypothetical protein
VALAAVAALAAAFVPSHSQRRYRALAAFELREDEPGADVQTKMESRLRKVERRAPSRYSRDVAVVTAPYSRRVQVTVVAQTARLATDSANIYAADLLSDDLGLDREALVRTQARLGGQLRRATEPSRRRALRRQLQRLERRLVTNADFAAATGAVRVGAPDRLIASFAAAVIGLLIGLAALAVRDRLGRGGQSARATDARSAASR